MQKVMSLMKTNIAPYKTKLEKRFSQGSIDQIFTETEVKDDDQKEYDLVRTKKFPVKPISLDEAILELNMIGHSFYMFRNEKTNEINVVYKRNDGKYGVLVPDDM